MRDKLIELRKRAEDAVSGMADDALKLKAFETILAHLLSTGASATPEKLGDVAIAKPKEKVAPKPATSITERLLSLKAEGLFEVQRSIAEVRVELKKNGWHYPLTSLSGPLQVLVQKRELRRERVSDDKGKKGWRYSNP